MDYIAGIDKKFIAESAEVVSLWRQGETPGRLQITLYPTNKCNLQCKHCWQHTESGDEFVLRAEDKAALPEHVNKAIQRAAELGVNTNTNLKDFLDEMLTGDPNAMAPGKSSSTAGEYTEALCYAPFSEFVIQADANIAPCCMADLESRMVKDSTLEEAWLGPYMTDMRESFLDNRPMSYCARCPASNFTMIEEIRDGLNAIVRRDESTAAQEAVRLTASSFSSLKTRGLSGTAKRLREWVTIKMR